MANWAVVAGHNSIIPGASGNGFQEHVIARQLKDKVIHYLRQLGETAHDCTDEVGRNKTDVWMNAAKNCNKAIGKKGIIIAIHLNSSASGSGTGTEVLDYKGTQKALCQAISARLAKDFAWRDRGWKDGSGIGLIKETDAPIVYVEACFINNASDITKLTRNMDMAAIGIVEEATGKKVLVQPALQTTPKVEPVFFHAEGGPIAKVRVIADNVNIYAAPDGNSAVVRKAIKGEEFDVYTNQNDWHNVGGAHWIKGNDGDQNLSLINFRVVVDNLSYGQARNLVPELQNRFGGPNVWGEPK